MLELNLASMMTGTLRNPLVCMTLLGWNLLACYFIGTGEPDIPFCDRLIAPLVQAHPKVIPHKFIKKLLELSAASSLF
uniref:Uncharacterized protein n=1 Tax=Panagrolaimus sp. ES5 TaxID=591445 RepID=A0AC34GVZ2_9BILA